ncbi:MAG: AEC family transporter [Ruminococcaceae bacterium]|nr:AEC family transporter [Oscillospiraceae bacterium]
MPILLLILVGYFLREIHFADDAFFKKANTMVFKVFLPVLLFNNVYAIESLSYIRWDALLFCVAAVLIICLVAYLTSGFFARHRKQKGVLTQCAFRSNYAIIGIPLAESLGGAPAVAFASVLSAVAIPLFNVLAVIILSHYADDEKEASVKKTLIKTAKNPLIIGVLTGVLVVFLRNILPFDFTIKEDIPFLYTAMNNMSKIASPLALIVLGARFDFSKVSFLFKQIMWGTLFKTVITPVSVLTVAVLLSEYTGLIELSAVEYPAFISLFASPVAVSSAVMVGEIGGDEQLAGQLVVWTSLLSMFTMFFIIFAMKALMLI